MRHFPRLLRAGALAIAAAAFSGASLAAQAANDGFVLAKPGDIQTERLPATPLVFGAYAIVWIVVTVYVLSLWRRIAKTEQEVAAVAARLEQQRR